jgi:hypothetical protein
MRRGSRDALTVGRRVRAAVDDDGLVALRDESVGIRRGTQCPDRLGTASQ